MQAANTALPLKGCLDQKIQYSLKSSDVKCKRTERCFIIQQMVFNVYKNKQYKQGKPDIVWEKAAMFPATLLKYIPPSPSLYHD